MGSVTDKSVYQQVVEVAYEYLGPAAERFVSREIQAHLGKKPENLTKEDIVKCHDWCKLALALMTDDNTLVDEFSSRLLAIAQNRGE